MAGGWCPKVPSLSNFALTGREFCLSNPQSPVTRSLRFRPLILQLYLQHLTLNPQPSSAPLPPFSHSHSHATIASFIYLHHILLCCRISCLSSLLCSGRFFVGRIASESNSAQNSQGFSSYLANARPFRAPKPKRDSFRSCLPPATHPTTTHSVIVWSRCFTATIIPPSCSLARLLSQLLHDCTLPIHCPRVIRYRRRHVLVGHAPKRHRPSGQGMALCQPGAKGLQDAGSTAQLARQCRCHHYPQRRAPCPATKWSAPTRCRQDLQPQGALPARRLQRSAHEDQDGTSCPLGC